MTRLITALLFIFGIVSCLPADRPGDGSPSITPPPASQGPIRPSTTLEIPPPP